MRTLLCTAIIVLLFTSISCESPKNDLVCPPGPHYQAPETPRLMLLDEFLKIKTRCFRTGGSDSVLNTIAEEGATLQAIAQQCSHAGWDARLTKLATAYPGWVFREVVCDAVSGLCHFDSAKDIATSLQTNTSNWSVLNASCDAWGLTMVKGKNDTYYACIILGYKNNNFNDRYTPAEVPNLIDQYRQNYWPHGVPKH